MQHHGMCCNSHCRHVFVVSRNCQRAESILRSPQLRSYSRISPIFVYVLTRAHHWSLSKATWSSSQPHSLCFHFHYNLILPSTSRFPKRTLPFGCGFKSCVLLLSLPCMLHVPHNISSYKNISKSHYFLAYFSLLLPLDEKINVTSINFPKTFYTSPWRLMFPLSISLWLLAAPHGYPQLATKYCFLSSSRPTEGVHRADY
jgi:hypothetical protein